MDRKDYLFIIGAAKCGTTSVAHFAASLPDAALSDPKETLYFTEAKTASWSGPSQDFASDLPKTEAEFRKTFSTNHDAQLRIEASTDHLWWPGAAKAIKTFGQRDDVGKLRILVLLRDPVDRIVSEYEHTLKLGWQRGSLLESLQAEDARKAACWHPLFYHITRSRYAAQLAHYRTLFDPADLLILDFHSLQDAGFQTQLSAFLGCDPPHTPRDMMRDNTRYVPTHHTMHAILKNQSILAALRKIIPKPLRAPLRHAVTPKTADRYVPNTEEIAFIRHALASDTAACLADPDIPTAHWNWT